MKQKKAGRRAKVVVPMHENYEDVMQRQLRGEKPKPKPAQKQDFWNNDFSEQSSSNNDFDWGEEEEPKTAQHPAHSQDAFDFDAPAPTKPAENENNPWDFDEQPSTIPVP
jgi:hypothetical protein